jgi:hypothetical protein
MEHQPTASNAQRSEMSSGMGYGRFAAMIATSTIVMFGLMYLNTYAIEHVRYSQTRTWMALLMGATMALIMIGYMWKMYKNRAANIGIVTASIAVFLGALWLVRSQETVGDVAYMKAMIPHHSIAIMTSERANIRDPEVRLLADRIIDAQIREITEMERLIAKLEANRMPDDAPVLPSYRDRGVDPRPSETSEETGVNTTAPVTR